VQPQSGCRLSEYAIAKLLPAEFLEALGLTEIKYSNNPAVRIPYYDLTGEEVVIRFRTGLEKSKYGDNRFRWKSGNKPTLYGLWKLKETQTAGYVVLVEGESDCHTLWYHDVPALGIPGAAIWKEEWVGYLDEIPIIYVVIEPDQGGQSVQRWLETTSFRERVKLVRLDEHKDPSSLYLSNPSEFKTAWERALNVATLWVDSQVEAQAQQSEENWDRCAELAKEPCILDRFAEYLEARGVAGESNAAKILYLGITSRLLKRPISFVLKAQSSAGKNFVAENVLAFFPPSASFALSAMSDRALVYSKEPLQHRMLVLYEAAGLQGEFATYLIRSLLSEGHVRYETTVKVNGKFETQIIDREGPTGLITTTTALSLHPENEARLVSIGLNDSPDQTRNVMEATANEFDPEEFHVEPDWEQWIALQRWLEGADHGVVIPYAKALATLIPPVAVRLRRDFKTILIFIQAHAILHQATRERDSQGRIIATVKEDYRIVQDLVADCIGEGVEVTVSTSVRETVNAVVELLAKDETKEVSIKMLVKSLELHKSTIKRRVDQALKRGYLQNLEDKKGKPYRLVLGDPLPEDQELLPDPEILGLMTGCTVARQTGGMSTPPLQDEREEFEL